MKQKWVLAKTEKKTAVIPQPILQYQFSNATVLILAVLV
jgi:hypothetical protein